MITPGIDAYRFLAALGAGWLLGISYEFLRPLRPRYTAVADLLFILLSVFGWFWVGFAVCDGDLRPAYLAGMFLGEFLFIRLPGRLLRFLFRGFWRGVAQILAPVEKIFHKKAVFQKIFVAYKEKSVKIKKKTLLCRRNHSGGGTHGKSHSAKN